MRLALIHFRRRTLIVIAILALLLSVIIAAPVKAASSTNAECDPISSGLWAGVNLVFKTNYGCKQGSQTNNQNNKQQAPNQQPSQPRQKYVALGDSVAAGIGLSPRTVGTDPVCGVTDQSYPARVAATLNTPYQNLACSGATAGDLVTEQHLSGTSRDIEPQLDRAFAGGKPTLITITAGANDIYWTYFLNKCYTSGCGTSTDDTVAASLLAAYELKLEYILASISTRSNGQPPRVVLTGYYQPVITACAQQQTNVTKSEISWLRSQMRQLNQTIQDVVSDYSFARYAPVSFSGHELCSSDPWVQEINSVAPFHPTAKGQQVIADAVLNKAK